MNINKTNLMMLQGVEFSNLPEGCIANILSFTTPRDVCRLSLVSSTFRCAAESDAVWDRFLPSNVNTMISQISSLSILSKKNLYFYLCQNPLIIDDGKKSFQLEKETGKKCFMLSARILSITWGDTPRYWRWISIPESRFSEVAELVSVCWLEIRGCINTRILSPKTLYGAYIVFKANAAGTYGFENQSVEVSIGLSGCDIRKRTVFLDAERGERVRHPFDVSRVRMFNRAPSMFYFIGRETEPTIENNHDSNVEYPKQRGDGWLEMELGEFYNEGEENEVEMGVNEIKGGNWKRGLLVQGIEIRPKP